MTDEPQYLEDPLAIGLVQYLARKGQVDASKWIAPEKSGMAAVVEAHRNVQARADQHRREQAEAEIAKVLEQRGVADLLAYHLAGGSGDVEPSEEVPLNSPALAVELNRILNDETDPPFT